MKKLASRAYPPQDAEAAFKNPVDGLGNIPPELAQNLSAQAADYKNRYAQHSFTSQHPVLTGLAGLALLGPAGLALPLAAQRNDERAHSDMVKAWNDYTKGQLENQKALDSIRSPRYEAQHVNKGIQTEVDAGRINPNTPMLDSNGVYSSDFLKHTQNGAMNPAALGLADSLINNQQSQSYGLPSQISFGQQQGSPNLPKLDMGQPTLNASASQVTKGLNTQYDPTQLPTFINDSTLGHLLTSQTSAATNGLTTGQQRMEFDAKAPQREAELNKSLQEIQNLILTGKQTQAETKLKQLQAKWYGPLTQSEIARNNRGPAPQQPTNASELARVYQEGGFGKPGSPEALKAYSAALQNAGGGGYTTQTTFTRDDEGRVIGSNSQKIPVGGGSLTTAATSPKVLNLIQKYSP